MADAAPVVHIGENSPEHVAFKLMERIAVVERKSLHSSNPDAPGYTAANREWILDTYTSCLRAAKGYRTPKDE